MTSPSPSVSPLVDFSSVVGDSFKPEPAVVKKSESVSSVGSSLGGSSLSSGEGADSFLDEADDKLNPRFKTEMCRNFKEKSKCLYGDQCQFAHGRRELRDVVRNTKYKTKHCQKYWVTGYCAYGPRCNFLHNEPVLRDDQQSASTIHRSKFACVKKTIAALGVSPAECRSSVPFNPCVGSECDANIRGSVADTEQEKFGDIFASMDRWTDSVYESLVGNENV